MKSSDEFYDSFLNKVGRFAENILANDMNAGFEYNERSWFAYIRSELMDVRFCERVAIGYRIPIKGGETRLAFDTCLLGVRVHVLTADYQLTR